MSSALTPGATAAVVAATTMTTPAVAGAAAAATLFEPFNSVSVAGDMRSVGGSLVSAGPTPDTVLVSVSPSSVALLRPEYARPIRSWFSSKPSMPFTTTAVWDQAHSRIVSASQGKVLAWPNSERAVPSVVVECQSDVLSLLPCSGGVAVVCRNGLAFRLHYDRPNWSVQLSPSVKGTFSWATILDDGQESVVLLADDAKSLVRFALDDPNAKTVIKVPVKFSVAACCALRNASSTTGGGGGGSSSSNGQSTLFVGNSQGKVLYLEGDSLVPSKIDLKLDSAGPATSAQADHLTALLSCDRDLLVASQTKVSLWDVQFGLMKASTAISFAPWPNKCLFVGGGGGGGGGNKALFAHTSLVVLPMRVQRWSLAALAGSKRRSDCAGRKKAATICADFCSTLALKVDTWSPADMQKQLQQVDDLTEALIVKCWRRILAVDPHHQGLVNKLISARHECHRLTAVLHESMSLDEVQRSIELVAGCMAQVSLTQLGAGLLESLMDWACHLVDAHRNALKVSLRAADSETTDVCLRKLDESLQSVEALSRDLQEGRHNLKLAMDKTDRVTVPREKLYWVEPWPLLSNKG